MVNTQRLVSTAPESVAYCGADTDLLAFLQTLYLACLVSSIFLEDE